MNAPNDKKLRELLKRSIAPVPDAELKRDLWPQMLRRLNERENRVFWRLPWFDLALVALLAVLLFLYPQAILALLYQL